VKIPLLANGSPAIRGSLRITGGTPDVLYVGLQGASSALTWYRVETTPWGTAPTIAALTAAGSTATASVVGNDTCGVITVSPSGAGITTGNIFTLTFAATRPSTSYTLLLTPSSSDARTLGMTLGRASRATTSVTVATATALTSGNTYTWDYRIDQFG
jgi:hypothetical protein